MTGLEDRRSLISSIEQACTSGSRMAQACATAGITLRTLQRWKGVSSEGDRRPAAERQAPPHALGLEEQQAILSVANQPEYADVPPARIVPMLADQGIYIASESSFSRVLRKHGQTRHRSRARAPRRRRAPTTHCASAPNQVWCWDMTYLPADVAGRWFHLYLIMDLYSRKIVGWEAHSNDSADHATQLVKRTALAESVASLSDDRKPVLHGDNGATFKATTVLAMLHYLGIKPSYSRPRVSDDNAFVESLFRTAKYRPEFPAKGFADLEAARAWAAQFVGWYNDDHRHSSINYVTPSQRHAGEDVHLLAARHQLYQNARASHPSRWSRGTRNWSPVATVTLNPDKDVVTEPLRIRA